MSRFQKLQEALQLAKTASRIRSPFNSFTFHSQALREKAILKRLGAAEVPR